MTEVDTELKRSFIQSKLPGEVPGITLEPDQTAVLVIDVQFMNTHRDGKYGRWAREQGIDDQVDWYFSRLEQLTVPSIRKLIDTARQANIEVIYTCVASLTKDGREMGWRYKAWQMTDHVDSAEAQVIAELAPQPNDLVITKTCTSVFLGSHLDRYLRNMGIKNLIVCGVATNGCVESAVRDASDLEYSILLAEDGCATLSQQDQDNSVSAMHPLYAQAMCTDAIIEKIQRECRQGSVVSRSI